MRYNPPFGATDPNAGYSNGNVALGQRGSIPSAAGIEHTQREIINVITHAGLVPSPDDLTQLRKAIILLAQSQRDAIWVSISGSANELVLTAGDFTGLEIGQIFRGFAPANNTSGSVTANVNGAGAKTIRKYGTRPITHSDITAGAMIDLLWDGENMQLLNPRWGGTWRGNIATHAGPIASIEAGWQLADGTNGTPNLRDKFIIGARQDDAGTAKTNVTGTLTQSGGSTQHNHGGSTGSYMLTSANIPELTVDVPFEDLGDGLGNPKTKPAAGQHKDTNINYTAVGKTRGGSTPHAHDVSQASHLPPYYALAFVMKL